MYSGMVMEKNTYEMTEINLRQILRYLKYHAAVSDDYIKFLIQKIISEL